MVPCLWAEIHICRPTNPDPSRESAGCWVVVPRLGSSGESAECAQRGGDLHSQPLLPLPATMGARNTSGFQPAAVGGRLFCGSSAVP